MFYGLRYILCHPAQNELQNVYLHEVVWVFKDMWVLCEVAPNNLNLLLHNPIPWTSAENHIMNKVKSSYKVMECYFAIFLDRILLLNSFIFLPILNPYIQVVIPPTLDQFSVAVLSLDHRLFKLFLTCF